MPSKRKTSRKSNKNDETKSKIREKVSEVLELPKEIVLNIPKLTMLGAGDLIIENYKGIIEYDSCRIRVNTGIGIIRIVGDKLIIREITSEDIMVSGEIASLEFIK
jgi:sporulation protein YqfC